MNRRFRGLEVYRVTGLRGYDTAKHLQETGDRCDDVLRAEALNQGGSSFNVWQILAEIKGIAKRDPFHFSFGFKYNLLCG